MERAYYVYMLTNVSNRVLYTGVTNNLKRRLYEHKHELCEGFTKKYRTKRLVYYEEFNQVYDAISREKEIKGWRREKKNALIAKENPNWEDLSEGWFDDSTPPEK